MIMRSLFSIGFIFLLVMRSMASQILIPMDKSQKNHLKAYGIAYWVLKHDVEVYWLLNYRGGAFMFPNNKAFTDELAIRGVSYEVIADSRSTAILEEISNPELNQDAVKLEKPPKMAVYSPKTKQPWDDAVTLVLTYAEIPYDIVYDEEVLSNKLPEYDWLHLHHEDFTGQYGRFWYGSRNTAWYQQDVKENESMAKKAWLFKSQFNETGCCKKNPGFCFRWWLHVCHVFRNR